MAAGNAINQSTAGITTFTGTGFTGSAITQFGVLVAGASNLVSNTSVGSTGQVLQGNTGASPTYSTATYPSTIAINQLLYGSASNVISALNTANNGTLITSATGVPSWLANGTTNQVLAATTGSPPSWKSASTAGLVTSVSGTTNRITSTGGSTPVIDISTNYIGQTTITTLGTVNTGTWNSTRIAINFGGTNANSFSTSNGKVKYDGTSLVSSSAATIDSNNYETNTAQPSVYAKVSTPLSNVTGDGTTLTIIYDTVVTQQGSAYNSTTGIFTCPVAGTYICCANIGWTNLGASHNRSQINIIMTSIVNTQIEGNPSSGRSSSNQYTQGNSVIAKLNASDQIQVTGFVAGSTKTVGVGGESFGQYSSLYIAKLF